MAGYWIHGPRQSKWRRWRGVPWRSMLWGGISIAAIAFTSFGTALLAERQFTSSFAWGSLVVGATLWALFVYELTAD